MESDSINALIRNVPDFQTFMTVDELNHSAQRLAERYPQAVQVLPLGESRRGDPIRALKIGNGPKKALLFAMPHPNEPIGSLMLEYLSARLAEDDELRTASGYTWYILKCVDPDGTRLNEGWFKGPFTITNYARNFYRPPSHEQVEWTFPIDYKTLHFDTPLPETRALMAAIEQIRPDFIYSLHNSGFGGVYAYLSGPAPQFYAPFYALVESQGLPLHLGEPEVPIAVPYSKAIFSSLTTPDLYDFLAKNTQSDPTLSFRQGAGSLEYARRFCDPFFLVCEMPYFYNPSIHDTSPADISRREAILQNLRHTRSNLEWQKGLFEGIREQLTHCSPFEEAVATNLNFNGDYLNAQENWALNEPALNQAASVAEKFDNLSIRRFYQLLGMGMLRRLIAAQIEASGETPGLAQALQAAEAAFDEEAQALEAQLDYQVIPIQKLVRVQLGSAWIAATLCV